MKLPWQKPKDQYIYIWESEPYVFQRGGVYVIEWDSSAIELNQVQALTNFFVEQGIVVALNPIKVKRKKEQV